MAQCGISLIVSQGNAVSLYATNSDHVTDSWVGIQQATMQSVVIISVYEECVETSS